MGKKKADAVFAEKVNKKYGAGTIMRASEARAIIMRRFPFGVFAMDYASGGGFPIGRCVEIWGHRSSGKSTLSLVTVASAQRTCKVCLAHVEDCACKGGPKPFVCYWCDLEGDYEAEWATDFGVDNSALWLSRPETGEEAIDTIEAGLSSGEIDFVVVNSVAHLVPTAEIEDEAAQEHPGRQAKLVNKLLRKTHSSINAPSLSDQHLPSILLINQVRMKVGFVFGSPEVRPGGMGQDFSASVEFRVKYDEYKTTKKDESGEGGEPWLMQGSFTTTKNKVFVPRLKGTYRMVIRDHDDLKRGEIFEPTVVLSYAENYGLVAKENRKWVVLGEEFTKKGDLEKRLAMKDAFYRRLRKTTLDVMLGASSG